MFIARLHMCRSIYNYVYICQLVIATTMLANSCLNQANCNPQEPRSANVARWPGIHRYRVKTFMLLLPMHDASPTQFGLKYQLIHDEHACTTTSWMHVLQVMSLVASYDLSVPLPLLSRPPSTALQTKTSRTPAEGCTPHWPITALTWGLQSDGLVTQLWRALRKVTTCKICVIGGKQITRSYCKKPDMWVQTYTSQTKFPLLGAQWQ